MATIAQIRADLVGSSASYRSEMIAAARQTNESLGQIRVQVKNTADSISTLNKAAAGFVGFDAVRAGVENLLDAQKAAQQIHYSLLSATGSGTAADAAYKQVAATAKDLGLDLQSSALGFSAMSAAASANGISMRDQQAIFQGLARDATVLHLSADQTGRAITALSQIFGKGKIQAEELRGQLGDAIPGVVPRFQQAVLAMTKGTDLAGKSFDKLLQDGDLSVQRFLPALVQALNETGKGAEQAAGGLNATVNRLSTAWFNLKSDVSGGLFSDVTIASVDLLARNLDHLASIAGVVGGGVLARLAGGALGSAAGGAQQLYQQNILGPRMAADAEAAAARMAQATATAAAAEVKAAEAALARNAAWQSSAAVSAEASRDALAVAYANNEAAQATLAHQAGAATLSANLRAQRIASVEAAVAQRELAQAQANYDAAIASGSVAMERQVALENQLIRARAAEAAATDAAALANARAAEAAAASGAYGLAQRGAASLGNLALGLVGGPWGAAVAAIGAVGYAIYDTQKRSEDYRRETDELVKSIQQVREEAELAAKSFGSLDGSMTFKQGIEQYKQEADAVSQQRAALADLQAQADAIRARIASRSSGTAGGAFANLFDQRELDGVTQRIEALQGQIGPAATAVDALGNKLSGVLAPSIGDVKHALNELANGKSLLDVVFDLSSGADKGIASADAALASLRTGLQAFQAGTKELTDKAATDGLNNAQKAAYLYQQRLKDIDKLPVNQRAGARSSLDEGYTPYLQAAQRLDAADAAKKAATEATNQARQWKQQADSLNQSLQQTHNELTAQLGSAQHLTPAEKQLQDIVGGTSDAYNHASAALKAKMLAQAQANAELSKSIVLQQQEAAATARSTALQEQLAARIQRQTEANDVASASVGRGQELTQQLQDELRIRQEYDRQRQQYDKEAGRLAPGVAGSVGSRQYNDDIDRLLASQQQELAIYRAGVQARLDAEKDWTNGAQAALEDYASAAMDSAGQAKQAFTDAFSGLEDALTTFAITGKLSFTSLANSIIADIARMNAKAATSSILGYAAKAVSAYFGYDASGGAGASTYGNNGQVTHVDFGGGRATGGSTSGGVLYEVAEHGPELYQSGGRTYLLSGHDGHVTPATNGRASAGLASGAPLIVNITNTQGDKVQATAQESRGPGGARQLDIMIESIKQSIANDINRGQGAVPAALGNRYSLNKGQNLG